MRLFLKSADGYISNDIEFRDDKSAWWRVDEIGNVPHEGNNLIITNDGRFDEKIIFNSLSQGVS